VKEKFVQFKTLIKADNKVTDEEHTFYKLLKNFGILIKIIEIHIEISKTTNSNL
jgi:hypothetical protein